MPWSTIVEHPGFFSSLLGAVAGGSGAWAAAMWWIKQLRHDVERHEIRLDNHERDIANVRITRNELVTGDECEKIHQSCQKTICKKLDDLSIAIREDHRDTIENGKIISMLQEHLRQLEKRYDDERNAIMSRHVGSV